MEDIDFRGVDFVVAGNLNKLQKLGFGRKNQLSPQCVHTWVNNTSYTICSYNKFVNCNTFIITYNLTEKMLSYLAHDRKCKLFCYC